MILQTAVLSVLLCSVHTFTLQASFEKNGENSGNTLEDDDLSVSTLLEKANANLGKNIGDPVVIFGDITVPTGLQNADPCTFEDQGCKWPKASDGNVYVPYTISNQYSPEERTKIIRGLWSFAQSTCIRFTPRNRQRDFLDIQSGKGCFSSVGRRGGGQVLSLKHKDCIVKGVIQHELLHALGFRHEQSRSDRDQHVRILLQNVKHGMEHNFRKIKTRNLDTPYDYNSIMEYERYAFSRNGQPTIVPIPDPSVPIGEAKEMSPNDILRVNRLYRCSSTGTMSAPKPVPRNQVF